MGYSFQFLFQYYRCVSTYLQYRHAPLALTVIELVHSHNVLREADAEQMKQALREPLPLLEADQTQDIQLELPSGIHRASVVDWFRFFSRDRRTMLSCSARKTVLETADYQGWETTKPLFLRALATRLDASGLDGIDRIGLRYIDEVRIPTHLANHPWSRWARAELLPPMADLDGLTPEQQQAQVQYRSEDADVTVTMRYGLMQGPPAVVGKLRPDPPAAGEYFLFDTDVAWTLRAGEPSPEVEVETVSEQLDQLHRWSKELFEWWPTDALREEVFNAE